MSEEIVCEIRLSHIFTSSVKSPNSQRQQREMRNNMRLTIFDCSYLVDILNYIPHSKSNTWSDIKRICIKLSERIDEFIKNWFGGQIKLFRHYPRNNLKRLATISLPSMFVLGPGLTKGIT